MATLLLSAAGAAAGGLISAPILGMTGAVVGRAVGATLGRVIDQRLMGTGSDPIEVGQTDRLRITGAGEGAPIAQLYGRMRMGGHVIWATQFQERTSTSGGSGKGAPPQPQTTTYSYSISLAVALCEGEIARVGRIWADGVEIDREAITWRLYKGSTDQMPDPLLEAVEGEGAVPAYRGTAYIVFEDLDLTPFGNRVPQFAFEVVRPARPAVAHVPSAAEAVRAVALMPGTGEYALATTPVSHRYGLARGDASNVSAEGGLTDFSQSLQHLRDTLPNLESVSLIYSWFGDDLRAGHCAVRPKVEQSAHDGVQIPWSAGGITRAAAQEIVQVDGRPVYGGTPADASVIEAIAAIHAGGQKVTFYPFLLMEALEGNGLPDPYGGAEQAVLPWRGRITGDVAPGQNGSTDGTPANRLAVQAFFGTATASDFTVGSGISYSGPEEWSYSRFILHCAALCAQAGGVEAFCIGSEMRGLTQMRDNAGFPAVAAYVALAAEVRALLPDAKITYAADWTEYFGYQPQDGTGDVYFHLDALWADDNIDVIAIDNYMPMSDWRDGQDHADVDLGPIHALAHLKSQIEGGEGFDYYYSGPEARAAQRREPITDGAHNPWTFRFKDLRGWWENQHGERRGGVRLAELDTGSTAYDGVHASGTYWVAGADFSETSLPIANAAQTDPAIARFEVPGEGWVLQCSDATRRISERGTRPFIRDQITRVTVRTRLLSEFASGAPFEHRLLVVGQEADGSFGGTEQVARWAGMTSGDGWVEQTAVFTPNDLRGGSRIASNAKSWRLGLDLCGPVDGSPVGAVQQVSEITVSVENATTAWVPRSKPIWFTEFGCAAIDKGTNQPNKFLDPKSSESAIPRFSNGRRDDLIQAQYLRAIMDYWAEDGRNPQSDQYDGPMLDMGRAHAWAWDARPWPAFPNDVNRWSDGPNWRRGHWLTGRLDAQPLDLVVAEICEDAGITDYDVSALYGLVRGHVSAQTQSARARLQPLMLAYGFHAVERDGKLVFVPISEAPEKIIQASLTARDDDGEGGFTHIRAPEAETVGRLRIGYTEAEGGYDTKVAEAVYPGDGADQVNDVDLPLALTQAEGQGMAERWLAEGRVAQDTLRFALPPSDRALGAGSLIATEDGHTWRVDRVEDRGFRQMEAIRVQPSTSQPSDEVEEVATFTPFVPPLPVTPIFLDLPLLTGDEVEHAPHLAVAAEPWPGSAAVYSAPGANGFTLNKLVERPAIVGTLLQPMAAQKPGIWDRSGKVQIHLETGNLSSAEVAAVLAGANAAAIGSGEDDVWEVMQFAQATLVGPDTWEIGLRLRGQQGTDAVMPAVWPVGSVFVLLDGAVGQVDLTSSARGLERYWRVGPSRRSVDDPSYTEKVLAFQGIGLRPYSPVHLRASRNGAGRDITWIRRSRIDADSWDGTDVPLGEASEQYIVRVVDATTIRREVVLTAPRFSYTDAMRASDGTFSDYFIEVAQVSERFGAGPIARIQIND